MQREMCATGTCVQESPAMIDSTKLSSSLAMALRDRRAGIPIQPNRSLPLRPAPPIPTRSPIVKSSKDSPILKLTDARPATLGRNKAGRTAGTTPQSLGNRGTDKVTYNGKRLSNVLHGSDDEERIPEATKDHGQADAEDVAVIFDENANGWYTNFQRSSIIEQANDRCYKDSSSKEKARTSIEADEHAEDTSVNQHGELLARKRTEKVMEEEKMVPPIKLKKVLPGAEETMNYKVVPGTIPPPLGSSNVSEERASNLRIVPSSSDSNDRETFSQIRSTRTSHQKSIPVCPIAIPISFARKFNRFVSVQPKPVVILDDNAERCNLPSMPSLEDSEVVPLVDVIGSEDRSIRKNEKIVQEGQIVRDNDSNANRQGTKANSNRYAGSTPKRTSESIDRENVRSTSNKSEIVEQLVTDRTNGDVSSETYIRIHIPEYVLSESGELEAKSTTVLSPGIREATRKLGKYREREKVGLDALKKMGEMVETAWDGDTPRKKNLLADGRTDQSMSFADEGLGGVADSELKISAGLLRKEASVRDDTLLNKSSAVAAPLERSRRIRRNDEEKLKHRRNKLRLKVQALQKQATRLGQQMSSTNDIMQRTRIQQMINCSAKQIENLTKHLNKLSVGHRVKRIEANQPAEDPRRTISSPEPPRLSPRSPPNNCTRSPKELRDSPPVLPRVGITIPQNLEFSCGSKDVVPESAIKFDASSLARLMLPEVVNLTDDEAKSDDSRRGNRELEDESGTSLTNGKEPANCRAEAAVPADAASSSIDGSVSFRTSNFVPYEVDHSMQMASIDSRLKSNRTMDIVDKEECKIGSNRIVRSPRTAESVSAVSAESKTNGCLSNTNYTFANPNANVSHADSNSGYDRSFRSVDYERIGNGQRDSNLIMSGDCYYASLDAQDYAGSSNVNVNRQIAQTPSQSTEMNSSSLFVDRNERPISSIAIDQSQPLQSQPINKSIDNLNLNSSLQNDAEHMNSGQQNSHRILNEPFPTLGNWAAQMSKKQKKSKRKSTMIPPTAQSTTYGSSDFRVSESDAYKVDASTANVSRNNVGSEWVPGRWQEQQVSFQGFYPPNVAPYCHGNYSMNPYSTAYGHPPMYFYDPFQYSDLYLRNAHQVPIGSLNAHPMQHPLQNSQRYSTEMLKRPTPSATFQNPIGYPNYLHASSSTVQGHGTNVPRPGYNNDQFGISENLAFEKAYRSKNNGLSPLTSTALPQVDSTVPSPQMDCIYLPSSSSENQSGTFVSSESNHDSKSSVVEKAKSPLSSMTLISFSHMQLTNVDRNCETPHLGKVEHSTNILRNLKCSNCGQSGSTFKCLGCGLAFYCNETCQIQHWSVHVKSCPKKMPKLKKVG